MAGRTGWRRGRVQRSARYMPSITRDTASHHQFQYRTEYDDGDIDSNIQNIAQSVYTQSTPAKSATDDTNAPLAPLTADFEVPDVFEVEVGPGGRTGLGAGPVPV